MEDTYRSQFRLPYPLYERLKKSADASRRSVNAELVARLEASLELDLAMDEARLGDHSAAVDILRRLLAENEQLGSAAAISKSELRAELAKVLDERIDLLESRLLSLPGSSFGKKIGR